jgi:hypothetical protein
MHIVVDDQVWHHVNPCPRPLGQTGGLICADTWDKFVADPDGQAFWWRQQTRFPQAAETGAKADTV